MHHWFKSSDYLKSVLGCPFIFAFQRDSGDRLLVVRSGSGVEARLVAAKEAMGLGTNKKKVFSSHGSKDLILLGLQSIEGSFVASFR